LDIGCGTGKSTEPLIETGRGRRVTVVGVDPDEAMLHEARLSAKKKRLPIEYIQGSAERLPFAKESFDAAVSGAAFHWFGNKDAMTEIKNVLKENGVFIIFWAQYIKSSKPTIGAKLYEKYDWKGIPQKFRSQKFVSELLVGAGFKNVEETTVVFSERQTIAQSIGNLKTNSSYILMSPQTKNRFIGEMTKAYKIALGKNKSEVNSLELRICYGFK